MVYRKKAEAEFNQESGLDPKLAEAKSKASATLRQNLNNKEKTVLWIQISLEGGFKQIR